VAADVDFRRSDSRDAPVRTDSTKLYIKFRAAWLERFTGSMFPGTAADALGPEVTWYWYFLLSWNRTPRPPLGRTFCFRKGWLPPGIASPSPPNPTNPNRFGRVRRYCNYLATM